MAKANARSQVDPGHIGLSRPTTRASALAEAVSRYKAVASACDVVSEVSATLEPDVSAGGSRSVRRRSARRRAAEPSHTRHRF